MAREGRSKKGRQGTLSIIHSPNRKNRFVTLEHAQRPHTPRRHCKTELHPQLLLCVLKEKLQVVFFRKLFFDKLRGRARVTNYLVQIQKTGVMRLSRWQSSESEETFHVFKQRVRHSRKEM